MSDLAYVGVVVPTRNRPDDLRRCLRALARCRETRPFPGWVCDSSDPSLRESVREVCEEHDWVELRFHTGTTISAARNLCAEIAQAELLVSVDDDVEVEPQAVDALVETYEAGTGPRVVGGAVSFGEPGYRTAPMRIRRIGYGRLAARHEAPEFLNSALFLYPRSYGLTWPWSERVRRGSDLLMGAIWRAAGVQMLWAKEARADHPIRDEMVTASDHGDHLYAILAHALVSEHDPGRALLFQGLGFAAGVKAFARNRAALRAFVTSWCRGTIAFMRDRKMLKEIAQRPAPRIASRAVSPAAGP
jgi:glycosyltransferase involved in cell wall biosynthesis